MRHTISVLLIGLTVLLGGCGGGGGSSAANSSTNNPEKRVELSSEKKADVTLNGTGGDTLHLAIPPLGAGTEDVNVTISLAYNGDLPEIVIDRDINFSVPVTLTFTSTHLVEGNTTLVYHAPGKTYYIPSAVVGHTLTATLQHFSKYGFDNLPVPSQRLKEDIDSRLAAMKAKAENAFLDAFNSDELDDLFAKISVYEGSDDFQGMLDDFAGIIEQASLNTLKYYQNNRLEFFSGNCPTDALQKAMDDLVSVYWRNDTLYRKFQHSLMEEDRILSDSMRIDAKLAFEKVLKDSKSAWELLFAPKCDPKLHDYIKCTKKYIAITETAIIFFPDSDTSWIGADVEETLRKTIEHDAENALNDGDCDCMLFYKDILNTYFAKDLASTISRLDSATQQCGTRCPLLWDITETVNGWYDWNPDFKSSGTAHYKDVYIEQRDDAWVDLPNAQREACAPYQKNKSVTASSWSGLYFGEGTPEGNQPPGIGPFVLLADTAEDEMTQENFNNFTIQNSNTEPTPHIYIGIPGPNNPYEDLYPKLNRFKTFTTSVDTNGHGTITFTFTPHVPGFKYPKN